MRAVELRYSGRFPPSFEDNGWIYGFALFGLALVTGLAIAILTGYMTEKREGGRLAQSGIISIHGPATPCGVWPLYRLYKFKMCCLLWATLLASGPDVLALLAWGEVSESTMWTIFQADRLLDGAAAIPFLMYVTAQVASGQAVGHALSVDARVVDFAPAFVRLRDKLGIAFWSFVIATGVTLYKANVAG